jgi:CDP-diacylglycerol--inositol 3-phosphatidyltransferase
MRSRIPVVLYIPNLLGYARIFSALVGLHISSTHPVLAIWIWLGSASLDLIDGILARRLNQCSQLGIFLDIVADIVLRTCCWLAALVAGSSQQMKFVVCAIISIEWFTMVSTQLHAAQNQSHWKSQRDTDPWLVRQVFSRNFKSPLGMFAIYGLFSANLWTFAYEQPEMRRAIPWFNVWMYSAYVGRVVALCVELWLCYHFLAFVVAQDTEKRNQMDQPKQKVG